MAAEAKQEVKKVQVAIQWCGGWGYGPKFRAAKVQILFILFIYWWV